MPRPARWIGVIGPGEATAAERYTAEEVGAGVAAAGAVLVCGGLGGVMEAACRGARSRGGVTVGLLPGLDREDANGWVTFALPTGMGEMRNALIVRAADVLIAVGGGWGTLSEIALALKAGRRVVGVGYMGTGARRARAGRDRPRRGRGVGGRRGAARVGRSRAVHGGSIAGSQAATPVCAVLSQSCA